MLFCRTLTSLYDENKLSLQVTYNHSSQKSALNVSLIIANANTKNETTSRGLVQVLVTVTVIKMHVANSTYTNTIAFSPYVCSTRTLFRTGTYGRTLFGAADV